MYLCVRVCRSVCVQIRIEELKNLEYCAVCNHHWSCLFKFQWWKLKQALSLLKRIKYLCHARAILFQTFIGIKQYCSVWKFNSIKWERERERFSFLTNEQKTKNYFVIQIDGIATKRYFWLTFSESVFGFSLDTIYDKMNVKRQEWIVCFHRLIWIFEFYWVFFCAVGEHPNQTEWKLKVMNNPYSFQTNFHVCLVFG